MGIASIVEVDFRARNNPTGALSDFGPVNPSALELRDMAQGRRYAILQAVADDLDAGDVDRLRAKHGPRSRSWALHVAMYLMRREGLSSTEIGITCRRPPSQALDGVRQVNWMLQSGTMPGLPARLRRIMESVDRPHREVER